MKKLSLLLIVLALSWTVSAQIVSIMEDYKRKQAVAVEKARVQALLSSVPQDYIIVYAKEGVLRYLLKDGRRTDFFIPTSSINSYIYRPVSEDDEYNRLAILVDTLSAQGWTMNITFGGGHEIYIFNRGRNQNKKTK